jgi:hypothetical protein
VKISAPTPIIADLTADDRSVKEPNFFIVGAPKSATTSMHYYLRKHPEIFMSIPKEPFYFGSDLDSHQLKTQDRREYHSFFQEAHSEKYRGESTVWYLYSENAHREIQEYNPNSKILIMLRNPIDAAHAMHSQFLFSGNEPIEDFEKAMNAESRRRRGENIHSTVYFPEGLHYRKVFSYASQVRRYLDTFDPDQVKILLLEDLKSDTNNCYRDVLDFLGVGEYEPEDFGSYNGNCRLKSEVLRELVRYVPGRTLGALREFVPVRSCSGIWRQVKPFFVDHDQRDPLDPDFRAELVRDFEPNIHRLESLIGRDLSHWLQVP